MRRLENNDLDELILHATPYRRRSEPLARLSAKRVTGSPTEVVTPAGTLVARPGDWVVQGVDGAGLNDVWILGEDEFRLQFQREEADERWVTPVMWHSIVRIVVPFEIDAQGGQLQGAAGDYLAIGPGRQPRIVSPNALGRYQPLRPAGSGIRVFISYSRADSRMADHRERLDTLVSQLRQARDLSVFLDVTEAEGEEFLAADEHEALSVGDYATALMESLVGSQVIVVLIGDEWQKASSGFARTVELPQAVLAQEEERSIIVPLRWSSDITGTPKSVIWKTDVFDGSAWNIWRMNLLIGQGIADGLPEGRDRHLRDLAEELIPLLDAKARLVIEKRESASRPSWMGEAGRGGGASSSGPPAPEPSWRQDGRSPWAAFARTRPELACLDGPELEIPDAPGRPRVGEDDAGGIVAADDGSILVTHRAGRITVFECLTGEPWPEQPRFPFTNMRALAVRRAGRAYSLFAVDDTRWVRCRFDSGGNTWVRNEGALDDNGAVAAFIEREKEVVVADDGSLRGGGEAAERLAGAGISRFAWIDSALDGRRAVTRRRAPAAPRLAAAIGTGADARWVAAVVEYGEPAGGSAPLVRSMPIPEGAQRVAVTRPLPGSSDAWVVVQYGDGLRGWRVDDIAPRETDAAMSAGR